MLPFDNIFNTTYMYLCIGCVLVISCVLHHDINFKNASSLITQNVCVLSLIHSFLYLLYCALWSVANKFSLQGNHYYDLVLIVCCVLINYISFLYPYYVFYLVRKCKNEKLFTLKNGFLNVLVTYAFICANLIFLVFIAIGITRACIGADNNYSCVNRSIQVLFFSSIVFFVLIVKDAQKFLTLLLKDTYLNNRATNCTLFIMVYSQLLLAPFAYFYQVPLFYTYSVLFVYTVHVVSQHKQISVDFLTGLNNRNELHRYLKKLFRKPDELDGTLYLLFIDVNDFKSINDTYGHHQGDLALLELASSIKTVSAQADCFVCRYAGDEFTIVFNETEELSVKKYIENLQNLITIKNNEKKHSFNLSVSVGYVSYTDKYTNEDDFINAADTMMYQEKEKSKAAAVLSKNIVL